VENFKKMHPISLRLKGLWLSCQAKKIRPLTEKIYKNQFQIPPIGYFSVLSDMLYAN
jgi:hypothetical protein